MIVDWTSGRYSLHKQILLASLSIILLTAVLLLFRDHLSIITAEFLYLGITVLLATTVGGGASIYASVVTLLTFNYFFVSPHDSMKIIHFEDFIGLAAYFFITMAISRLAFVYRASLRQAKLRQVETETLLSISRALGSEVSEEALLDKVVGLASSLDGVLYVDLIRADNDDSMPWKDRFGNKGLLDEDYKLAYGEEFLGVLRVRWESEKSDGTMARRIMQMLADQAIVALERQSLLEKATKAQGIMEADKFRKTLLSLVSHELRTPLTAIEASATSLLEESVWISEGRGELLDTIIQSSRRLNDLVGDLLDMSRLEAEAWSPKLEYFDTSELVGYALERLDSKSSERVRVELSAELPMVEVDFMQVSTVIWNLVENALKYSPSNQPVDIVGVYEDSHVELRVKDKGPGVSKHDLPYIFEKFYRGKYRVTDRPPGSGLGLAICKEIAKAHGGQVRYEDREGGGAEFIFEIPVSQPI